MIAQYKWEILTAILLVAFAAFLYKKWKDAKDKPRNTGPGGGGGGSRPPVKRK